MGKKKDWVEEIGNIELEISYISGVYDLAFLMGHGWYEEVEKIVEQIKQEAMEEVLIELQEEFSEFGVPDDVRYSQPLFYINGIIESKLSKLTTK